MVEAEAQLTRALAQIATLAGHAGAAPRADQAPGRAHERAHARQRAMRRPKPKRLWIGRASLIEHAEALGEPPEDPLLLFSVLYGFWVANYVAFNGEVLRELAAQFLALAERQGRDRPAHGRASNHGRLLAVYGDIAEGRAHFDRAIALYDPAEHRPLATRFGQDVGVAILILSGVDSVVAWLSRAPRAQTRTKRSVMRARSAKLPL